MKKIFLYEEIGPWLDLTDFQQLDENEPVTLFVNSPGGDLTTGLAIYNMVSRVKDLTVCIDGIAASAASLLAFVPNAKVKMNAGSFLFLHMPAAEMYGAKRADDLLRLASELEKMGCSILDIYCQKSTKCSREELEKMLEAETLLSAQESLQLGFCDEIAEMPAAKKMNFPARFVAKIDDLKKKKEEKAELLSDERNQAFHEGVKAERKRLQEIDELTSGFPEFENVIKEKKFSDNVTAGDIALLILREQKKRREEEPQPINLVTMYQALKKDAEECEIDGEPVAVDSTKKTLKDLALKK